MIVAGRVEVVADSGVLTLRVLWYTARHTVNYMNTNTPNKYERLIDAVGRNDLTAVKNLVQRIKVVPDYVLGSAIALNLVDQVAVLAPKCQRNTIGQGLTITIVREALPVQMFYALLPYTDQKMRTLAMAEACNMRRAEIVDELYSVCDVPKVLKILDKYSGPHIEVWKTTLQQRLDDEKLHETLMAEVAVPTLSTSRKL